MLNIKRLRRKKVLDVGVGCLNAVVAMIECKMRRLIMPISKISYYKFTCSETKLNQSGNEYQSSEAQWFP